MIKIDYTLDRDVGNKTETYRPVIFKKNKLPELSEISADNDFGKSTFLQIVAMSFGASKENVPNKELLSKINRLNQSYQSLIFNLIIDNPHFDDIFEINKPDKDKNEIIFSKTNRKTKNKTSLTPSTVRKNFKLIYDIPDQPLSRLKNLVDDVGGFQKEIISKLPILRQELESNIRTIKNQPTQSEINEIKDRIGEIKNDIDKINDKIDENKKVLSVLNDLELIRAYNEKKNALEGAEKKLKTIREKDKAQGPKPKEPDTAEKTSIQLSLNSMINTIENQIDEIKSLSEHNFANDMNLGEVSNKYDNIDSDDLKNKGPENSTIAYFLNCVENELTGLKKKAGNEKEQKDLAFYRDIISVFERFQKHNPKIPGVKYSANELIDIIKKKIEELGGLTDNQEDAKEKIENFSSVTRRDMQEYFKYYIKNKDKLVSSKQPKNYIDYSEKIEVCMKEKTTNKNELTIIKNKLIRRDIAENQIKSKLNRIVNKYKEFSNLTSSIQIINRQTSLENKLTGDRQKIEKRKAAKRLYEIDHQAKKDLLKKKNPFSKHLKILESYIEPATILSHRLNDMEQLVKKMKSNETIPNDEFSKSYVSMINELLAEKMQFVLHEGKKHPLKVLNYQDSYFITADDTTLRFEDFGTGHSQVNFLKGLLSTTYNNPMIVLLDETGNMSSKTIETLYEVLRKLYESGKILVGILVKPGDTPLVKEIK